MPRIAREYSKSNYYHIIVQGINKEYIFGDSRYIEKYQEIIIKKLKESNITILAYCIMGNHSHFLIYSEKIEYLSKYMQKVNTAYSIYYNKENKRVGYVFRDRYYSQDILDKKQLYNCLRYIHNNPVKANICKRMNEYKYSSYKEFIGDKKIINVKSIELLFETLNGYKEKFGWIHSNKYGDDEEFIDIKEKDIENVIYNFEKRYNKSIVEIKKDRNKIIELIKEARKETNVTIKELSNIFNIPISTIGRYIKK